MLKLREKMAETIKIINECSKIQKSKSRVWYDRSARLRVFKPGDMVLLLSTIPGKPLDIRYQLNGSYIFIEKVGLVNYIIATPERKRSKRMVHVNLLKEYFGRGETVRITTERVTATLWRRGVSLKIKLKLRNS